MTKSFIRLIFLSFLTLLFANPVGAQTLHKYAFYFKSKDHNLEEFIPETYFSPRTIARRIKNNAAYTEEDLPVSSTNLQKCSSLGLEIIGVSRWKNCAIIKSLDSLDLAKLEKLEWIDHVEYIYRGGPTKKTSSREVFQHARAKKQSYNGTSLCKKVHYWKAADQASMLKVDYLHNKNNFAKNIHIAIFDGGFSNVDKIKAFDHLFSESRILKTWDFVSQEEEVFGDGDHGTRVLACIAGFEKNQYMGNAPGASLYLFRTEDGRSETIMEEYNWLLAAEFSDSAGVDVVNSSLGYTEYDEGQPNSYSYSYKKLNGQNGIASFAAQKLAERGVAVCNSAGNSGNDPWRFIGVPADANGIFSVGAVDRQKNRAPFSSYGPTSDGRIKPDICALGASSCVIGSDGRVSYSSGTSFSSPIFCGALACFIGANYKVSLEEIYRAVIESSSSFTSPDNSTGYGIPDFKKASELLNSLNP